MYSSAQLAELEVNIDSTERESFAVSDSIKSKELKLREVRKTTEALPMHE